MESKAPIVIFVRPQAAGNIGAIARVMANFGALELRLVGESPVYGIRENDPFSKMDWALAKCGEEILKNLRWFKTLNDALEGVHIALGTSGRSVEFELGYGRPLVGPDEAFGAVREHQKHEPSLNWALVLGPEDDGLNDAESALCQKLIRIPTDPVNSSMNVAMATGCLLYHWKLESLSPRSPNQDSGAFVLSSPKTFTEAGREGWATHEHKERFVDYLMDTLSRTQFLKYPDHEAVKARVRRWLQGALLPLGELLFAFEIVYHLKAWGSGRFETRDFLSSPKKTPNSDPL